MTQELARRLAGGLLAFLLMSTIAASGCSTDDGEADGGGETDGGRDAGDIDGGRDSGGDSCFSAGTQIDTPNGSMAIEELQVGQPVWAFDHDTGQRTVSHIEELFVHEAENVRPLELIDGRVLWVTDSHSIYRADMGQYVRADELGLGAHVLTADTDQASALAVTGFGVEVERVTVYNISVAGLHNYFAEGVLVHNKSIDSGPADMGPADMGPADTGPADTGIVDADIVDTSICC